MRQLREQDDKWRSAGRYFVLVSVKLSPSSPGGRINLVAIDPVIAVKSAAAAQKSSPGSEGRAQRGWGRVIL